MAIPNVELQSTLERFLAHHSFWWVTIGFPFCVWGLLRVALHNKSSCYTIWHTYGKMMYIYIRKLYIYIYVCSLNKSTYSICIHAVFWMIHWWYYFYNPGCVDRTWFVILKSKCFIPWFLSIFQRCLINVFCIYKLSKWQCATSQYFLTNSKKEMYSGHRFCPGHAAKGLERSSGMRRWLHLGWNGQAGRCCLQTSSNQIEKGAWNKCKSIFISVYSMRKLHACLLHSKMTNLPSDSPNLSIDTPMSWYVAWVSHLCPLYFLCLLVILSWDFTSQPASFDLGVKTLELPRRA